MARRTIDESLYEDDDFLRETVKRNWFEAYELTKIIKNKNLIEKINKFLREERPIFIGYNNLDSMIFRLSYHPELIDKILEKIFPDFSYSKIRIQEDLIPKEIKEIYEIYNEISESFLKYIIYVYVSRNNHENFFDIYCEKLPITILRLDSDEKNLVSCRLYAEGEDILEKISKSYQKVKNNKYDIEDILFISSALLAGCGALDEEKFEKLIKFVRSLRQNQIDRIIHYVLNFIEFSDKIYNTNQKISTKGIIKQTNSNNIKKIPSLYIDIIHDNSFLNFILKKDNEDDKVIKLRILSCITFLKINNIFPNIKIGKICNLYTGEIFIVDSSKIPNENFIRFYNLYNLEPDEEFEEFEKRNS